MALNHSEESLLKIVDLVESLLTPFTEEEREFVFDELKERFCFECGTKDVPCHCWNDE